MASEVANESQRTKVAQVQRAASQAILKEEQQQLWVQELDNNSAFAVAIQVIGRAIVQCHLETRSERSEKKLKVP